MPSIIDSFRPQVEEACGRNDCDADIHRMLNRLGCLVGRERVRTWLIAETAAGRLPTRTFHSRRGRPPKAKKVPPPRQFDSPTAASADEDTESAWLAAIRVIGEMFCIPLKPCGSFDFMKWAQELGKERVQAMGDLEFFLVESLEHPWRDHPERWQPAWIASVHRSSQARRQDMIQIAHIHGIMAQLQRP